MFTKYISCQRVHQYGIMCTWYAIYEHVDMICIMCPIVQIMSTSYCFMCTWYVSCWPSLVVQDHVIKSCTVEYMIDIMETWLMSTISSIHILYHTDVTLIMSHVTHHGHMIPWHHVSLLRHVTGLWARPVIRYRPVTGPYQITTSPTRAGTGEPLHRLEPVPVRGFTGTGSPVGRFSKWQTCRSHRTKSVGLYHPTQRKHIQLNMSSEVRV